MRDVLPWLIPAFPLAAFALNGTFGRRLRRFAGAISTLGIVLSFACAVVLALDAGDARAPTLYQWVASNDFIVTIGFRVDPLAAVMLLTVTGISAVISLFAQGYMGHDAAQPRFFTWIPLFVFSMVMLVASDNLLELFIFWEMVGVCSYLLIGYWHERRSANFAATKAFIVNRVGDFGFASGVILAFLEFGSLRYSDIFAQLGGPQTDARMVTAIALLLFVGAMGKSAQFPLHVWLPDAMEGPTPVSALIHAATMVTAGVYLVARMGPLYSAAPEALIVVAAVGVFTAFLAATIALVQTDVKRVLAYSTVSQLGLMFLALGAGAYTVAIFHLVTHAFFKALLFLGSGSVIHALDGEQDMRRMGGLRPKLPVTYATFLIGSLALAAIFPFAGFWSKDEILAGAYLKAVADPGPALLADHGARIFWLYYAAGLVVSVLTAFYTFRMVLLTFHGQPRDVALHTHAHEAPVVMAAPLGALAVGALGAGAILGVPPENGLLHRFLEEVPGVLHLAGAGDPPTAVLAAISMAVALTGIALAYVAYQRRMDLAGRARRLLPGAQTFLEKKWYMDHLGDGLLVLLAKGAAYAAWGFDAKVVDGLVNLAGTLTRQLSGQLRRAQTGRLQNYALLVVVGLVLTVGGLMVFR